MATISITISDTDLARVVGDICTKFGYQSQILDANGNLIPNPQTQNQFARQQVVQTIKGWCADVESASAALTAANNATVSANQLGVS